MSALGRPLHREETVPEGRGHWLETFRRNETFLRPCQVSSASLVFWKRPFLRPESSLKWRCTCKLFFQETDRHSYYIIPAFPRLMVDSLVIARLLGESVSRCLSCLSLCLVSLIMSVLRGHCQWINATMDIVREIPRHFTIRWTEQTQPE